MPLKKIFLGSIFIARDKVKMQKEHVTGNFTGPEPPSLNNIDLFILAMLGESPSFKGVLSEDYDTEIEVPQTNAKGKTNLSKYEAKKCRTNLLSKTPDMTKAINSGTKKVNYQKIANFAPQY